MARAILSRSQWLAAERGAHSRALGGAQAFPLFGDGEHTGAAIGGGNINADADATAGALADARYLDWLAAQAGNHTCRPAAENVPPMFALEPAPPAAAKGARQRAMPLRDPALDTAIRRDAGQFVVRSASRAPVKRARR